MQYSLRPSPMALGRVGVGKEQNQAFLAALKERLDALPKAKRPRVVVFGESLGAQTGADTLFQGHHEMAEYGIDRALFIGMPASTPAPRAWRVDPDGSRPRQPRRRGRHLRRSGCALPRSSASASAS